MLNNTFVKRVFELSKCRNRTFKFCDMVSEKVFSYGKGQRDPRDPTTRRMEEDLFSTNQETFMI